MNDLINDPNVRLTLLFLHKKGYTSSQLKDDFEEVLSQSLEEGDSEEKEKS